MWELSGAGWRQWRAVLLTGIQQSQCQVQSECSPMTLMRIIMIESLLSHFSNCIHTCTLTFCLHRKYVVNYYHISSEVEYFMNMLQIWIWWDHNWTDWLLFLAWRCPEVAHRNCSQGGEDWSWQRFQVLILLEHILLVMSKMSKCSTTHSCSHFRAELLNKFTFSSDKTSVRARQVAEVVPLPGAVPPMFELQVSQAYL